MTTESLCPVCGRWLCDHTPSERGQTFEEMMRPLTEDEIKAFESGDDLKKIAAANKSQFDARQNKPEE